MPPTASERTVAQSDVLGSGCSLDSSGSANFTFGNDVLFNGSKSNNSVSNNNTSGEARTWMELTRMGEELCRGGPRGIHFLNYNHSLNGVMDAYSSNTNRSQSNRRFFNKSYDNNAESNNGNGRSNRWGTNGSDAWNSKSNETEDGSDLGWVRGVGGRVRQSNTFHSNLFNNYSNSNLPPRMLRKLAAEAGEMNWNGKDSLFNSEVKSFGVKRNMPLLNLCEVHFTIKSLF